MSQPDAQSSEVLRVIAGELRELATAMHDYHHEPDWGEVDDLARRLESALGLESPPLPEPAPEPADPQCYLITMPGRGAVLKEAWTPGGLDVAAQQLSREVHVGTYPIVGDGRPWGELFIEGPDVWRVRRADGRIVLCRPE